MRENSIEKYLVRKVEENGGRAPKWVSPGNRGVQDRLAIFPGGKIAFVETKSPGKPLEPLQKKWARMLLDMGHRVYKIDSVEDVDRFIQEVMPK